MRPLILVPVLIGALWVACMRAQEATAPASLAAGSALLVDWTLRNVDWTEADCAAYPDLTVAVTIRRPNNPDAPRREWRCGQSPVTVGVSGQGDVTLLATPMQDGVPAGPTSTAVVLLDSNSSGTVSGLSVFTTLRATLRWAWPEEDRIQQRACVPGTPAFTGMAFALRQLTRIGTVADQCRPAVIQWSNGASYVGGCPIQPFGSCIPAGTTGVSQVIPASYKVGAAGASGLAKCASATTTVLALAGRETTAALIWSATQAEGCP